MQTNIADKYKDDSRVELAESILRRCVHCGFCLATCPTYNLLGDELDSPRGRIYLIKQVLEGEAPSGSTQQHLDRCLTCRNCETTCPSGVEYGRLVDIGREIVEERVGRSPQQRLLRRLTTLVLPYPARVAPLIRLAQMFRFALPAKLRRKVPLAQSLRPGEPAAHDRRMLILEGCVQPSMTPATNHATVRVFDRLGIRVEAISSAGCCGAIHYHLNDQAQGLELMRRNIDAWWPAIESGVEAILATASGCGLMLKDYAHALAADEHYREKAARVSALVRDPAELLGELLDGDALGQSGLAQQWRRPSVTRVAFHPPCTLQHGQKLPGVCEALLRRGGFELTPVPDSHTCCGSAGTYSLFQPQIAGRLQANKVAALHSGEPEVIATANIGCQLHLQAATSLPVRHWIELLDEVLPERQSGQASSQ